MTEESPNSGMSIGRSLLYLTVICALLVFFWRYYQENVSEYTSVPVEMQINYVPADFTFDMDEDNALAILANPHRYRREFNELIYDFNMALLYHVARRMDLADSTMVLLEPEYKKHHPYLKQLYFNDFIQIQDTSANLYESWYNNESGGATAVLNEVASKYSCFLVNHVIMGLIKSTDGKINVKGQRVNTPCGIAMTEALRPMIKRLQDRAAIIDFSRSKGLMEEKVERLIAELATVEIRDKKAINKRMQTKIWGYAVSSSDVEISAISLLKAGFKLDQFFDLKLNSKRKRIEITLPEPVILSHEVYPKIDKLDIGWLREVKEVDFNQNFNALRAEFRRDALNDNVLETSKREAKELMSLLFTPLISSQYKGYKIEVRFKRMRKMQDDLSSDDEGRRTENVRLQKEEVPF
ncbi:MAG: DUF4230 domain-containing protein [Bacteroidota bacterium]